MKAKHRFSWTWLCYIEFLIHSPESLEGQIISLLHNLCDNYSYLNHILGVNLLLAIVLFSTIVGDMLPVTNNTPLIGQNITIVTKLCFSYWTFQLNSESFQCSQFCCWSILSRDNVVNCYSLLNCKLCLPSSLE